MALKKLRGEDVRKTETALTFVIVGGGPTGVELAGAIGELSRYTVHKDFETSIREQHGHSHRGRTKSSWRIPRVTLQPRQ